MVKKIVKRMVVAVYRCLTHLIPTKKGLVVFDSFMGKSYSGSVRAVYEWIDAHEINKKYTPVWVFTREALRKGLAVSPDCKIVTYGTISYYILMARASVWVFDTRHEGYLVKKKSQYYIQTWHGTPLKKLGIDIDTFSMKAEDAEVLKYKDKVVAESAKWDLLLSASEFTTKVFRNCFAYKGEMLECGYPRNDVLFDDSKKNGETYKKGNILYAPTWRDDVHSGEGWWYGYEPSLDVEALEKALADKWTLTVKLHYLVKCEKDTFPQSSLDSGFLRVAGSDEDMASLFKEADVLITDYSSVMFDYALLDKPMFFYAYDLERYRDKLRGWYFDFEKEAPGPISRDTGTLIRDILMLDSDSSEELKWQEKRRVFKEKFAAFENGHASERVAEKIELNLKK